MSTNICVYLVGHSNGEARIRMSWSEVEGLERVGGIETVL
jgi:hypothetical protein